MPTRIRFATLDLLVIAKPGVDAQALIAETYSEVIAEDIGSRPTVEHATALVDVHWSGGLGPAGGNIAWRCSVTIGAAVDIGDVAEDQTSTAFIDAVLDLARDADSGILAVVKLADPVQLHRHTALYREIYSLEMALREVVSYIFAAEFPGSLIDGLTKCIVKPASADNLPQDAQLIKYGENRFFYILFDKYAVLNASPDIKAAHIAEALKGGTNLDEVRDALDLRPIKEERHAGFLASLQTLMDPLERVRNAVAHNRTVPDDVRENFNTASARLGAEIQSFWEREAEHVGNGGTQATPPNVPPGPIAG